MRNEDWELDPRLCVGPTGQNVNVCVAEGCYGDACCTLGWQPRGPDALAHRTVDGICPTCLNATRTAQRQLPAPDDFPDLLGDLAHEIRRLVTNLTRKALRR